MMTGRTSFCHRSPDLSTIRNAETNFSPGSRSKSEIGSHDDLMASFMAIIISYDSQFLIKLITKSVSIFLGFFRIIGYRN